jgi:hypothetical protein
MASHDLQEAAIDQVRYLALQRATANAIIPTCVTKRRHG